MKFALRIGFGATENASLHIYVYMLCIYTYDMLLVL